eukprot:gene928-1797_t
MEVEGENKSVDDLLQQRKEIVFGRTENFLKELGLSPFSSKMCVAYIQSRLDTEGGSDRLSHFLNYLMSRITTYKPYASLNDTYQRGCPNIIPGLRAQPFWNTELLPWTIILEENFESIRAEFMSLKGGNSFQPYRAPTASVTNKESVPEDHLGQLATDKGDWNVCYLYLHGMDFETNREKCPITSAIIRDIPRQYNHALFSALAPHSHVTAHNGPTNKKLRCHLPLVVPPGNGCRLRVGSEWMVLEEGKCVVFDDSFEHEAENTSGLPRVVLIVDVWHPDLSDDEVKVFDFINKAQILAARRLARMEMEEIQRSTLASSVDAVDKDLEGDMEASTETTLGSDGITAVSESTRSFFTVIEGAKGQEVRVESVWGESQVL